ncbi:hypothetical protein [Anaerosporobacter sp.]
MGKQLTATEEFLTKDNQKASNVYLIELKKIESFKKQISIKKASAIKEIERLTHELAELNRQYMFETDNVKLAEIATGKKNIRLEIEDWKDITETDYKPILSKMIKDAEKYKVDADKEWAKFKDLLSKRCEEYVKEREAFEDAMIEKFNEINRTEGSHAFKQVLETHSSLMRELER